MNISKIAELAGVSKSTVSRFLNDGYVSESNKLKIQSVIDKTGYIPSSYAKTLRTKKTNLIGVILPKISSETISRVVDGISSEIAKYGYNVILGNTNLSVEKEIEYLNIFKNKEVDGIIFVATSITKKHIEIMKEIKIPIVLVGQNIQNYSCVYHDDFGASYSAVEYLIKNNKNNIGYIGVDEEDRAVGLERKEGYKKALEDNNIKVDNEKIKIGEFSQESGYINCKKLLSENKNIDAIFCVTDNIAIGAMEYIKEQNLNIPKDISIISIGDSRVSKVVTPKLTTMHYYYKTSGIKAAKIIMNKLVNNCIDIEKIKLGYELKERESIQ